jgi:hypothetical protein
MHAQLRRHLRLPSANSAQLAKYSRTREGFGEEIPYMYQLFKYPEGVKQGHDTINLTEEQCRRWAKTRAVFEKSYKDNVAARPS